MKRHPGGRRDGASWVGPNGNLWISGGFNLDSSGVFSDMWEYSISDNRWYLMYPQFYKIKFNF